MKVREKKYNEILDFNTYPDGNKKNRKLHLGNIYPFDHLFRGMFFII